MQRRLPRARRLFQLKVDRNGVDPSSAIASHRTVTMSAASSENESFSTELSSHDPRAAEPWTPDAERALLRRQRLNERAVQLSSVLSAAAVAMGAGLAFVGLYQNTNQGDVPASPVEPLAYEIQDTEGIVAFENTDIQTVSAEGLSLIRYPWRSELQGWEIAFLAPRGSASGYTWSDERRIEVFVKDGDDADRIARVLAHELGHAVDVTRNTGDERRAWLAERNAGAETEWWPISGRADFETGAGDFAEVFAQWQVGNDDFRSVVNPSIDAGDIALIAELSLSDPEQ